MSDVTLSALAIALHCAKCAENETREHRISVEEKIAALIETGEVGQKTVTLEDGVKITVKRALNYTADTDAIINAFAGQEVIPPVIQKTTWQLDVKGYEWYRKNIPVIFTLIEPHVSVKPAKVAVTLKMPE